MTHDPFYDRRHATGCGRLALAFVVGLVAKAIVLGQVAWHLHRRRAA